MPSWTYEYTSLLLQGSQCSQPQLNPEIDFALWTINSSSPESLGRTTDSEFTKYFVGACHVRTLYIVHDAHVTGKHSTDGWFGWIRAPKAIYDPLFDRNNPDACNTTPAITSPVPAS